MSWLSELIHHPKGGIHDITHFIGGQLGDVESAFSNITHGHLGRGGWSFEAPWLRQLLFEAPLLMAPEIAGPIMASTAAADVGSTALASDAASYAAQGDAALTSGAQATIDANQAAISAEAGVPGAATAADVTGTGANMMAPLDVTSTPLPYDQPPLDPSQLYAAQGIPGVDPATQYT